MLIGRNCLIYFDTAWRAAMVAPAVEKSIGADEEGIGSLAHKRCKCGIDLAAARACSRL